MPYREENDALRARVADLEAELDAMRERVGLLEGQRTEPPPSALIGPSRITGGPLQFMRTVELPYEVDGPGYEAIAEVLRRRLQLTNVSQVGRTLTARNGGPVQMPGEFSLVARDGRTHIELRREWRIVPVNVVMATGFTGVMTLLGTLILSQHGLQAFGLWPMVLFPPLLMIVTGAVSRPWSRKVVQTVIEETTGVFETVLALAERHAVRAPATRVAIEREAAPSEAEPSETGALHATAQRE